MNTSTQWVDAWKTAVPSERRNVLRTGYHVDMVAGDGVACLLVDGPIWADVVRIHERKLGEMRWLFDARERDYTATDRWPRYPGWVIEAQRTWPAIALPRQRVYLHLGDGVVFSLQRVTDDGTSGFGYPFAEQTVRMWLAGPSYPAGWNTG